MDLKFFQAVNHKLIVVQPEVVNLPARKAAEMTVIIEHDVVVLGICINIDLPHQSRLNKSVQGVVNGGFRDRGDFCGQGSEDTFHSGMGLTIPQIFQHFDALE